MTDQAEIESSFNSKLIGSEVETGIQIVLNETETEETIYLITYVDDWNTSDSFIYEATIDINYIIHMIKFPCPHCQEKVKFFTALVLNRCSNCERPIEMDAMAS